MEEWAWVNDLAEIWLGYATVLLPLALLVLYIRRRHARGKFVARGAVSRLLEAFSLGYNDFTTLLQPKDGKKSEEKSFKDDCIRLFIFSIGVTVPLWLMGVLQERLIAHPYRRIGSPEEQDHFTDMQFLVFCNRLFGLLVAGCLLFATRRSQPVHVPPYYFHSFTSIANIMSSWCQYSALQFVTFPTMTISKVSKVVSTMLMGRILRGQTYSCQEYATAAGIALGAGLFIVTTTHHSAKVSSTTLSGFVLIAGYLLFDSFTANWQKSLFNTRPKVSKGQMMFGVNAFSVLLSLVSLLEQGALLPAVQFALEHEGFLLHSVLMSSSAALAQLFIYATIDHFGPTALAVMMTVRQMGSILISILLYGHSLPPLAALGLFLAFSCLFLDIYLRYFKQSQVVSK